MDSDGKPHVKGQPFSFNGLVFRLTKYEHNAVGIEIEERDLKIQSLLTLVSFNPDSTGTKWQCEIPAGNNPVKRLLKYNQAMKISKTISQILQNLKSFVSNPQNVYGISVYKTSTRDTLLLSARYISKTYPTTAEIYHYLDLVEKNIQEQKGRVSGFPIIDIRNPDSDQFEIQVAIPTDRLLKNNGEMFYRRMVPGNFLCADVKGGPYTIQEAFQQMSFYVVDYNKSKIAKPFEQLVTNRLKEPDTSKWITHIYQPVIQ